jgi:hypothetical protein
MTMVSGMFRGERKNRQLYGHMKYGCKQKRTTKTLHLNGFPLMFCTASAVELMETLSK